MDFVRDVRRTMAHNDLANDEHWPRTPAATNLGSSATPLIGSPLRTTSTIGFPLSATSTIGFPLSATSNTGFPLILPSSTFPTQHVCTLHPSDDSITLWLYSRAQAANHSPSFYGGDNIGGNVILNFPTKDVQHVTSVDVELQGETFAIGSSKSNRFLSRKVNLWSSDDSRGLTTSPSSHSLQDSRSVSGAQTPNPYQNVDVQTVPSNSGSPPSSFQPYRAASTFGRSASSLLSSMGRNNSGILEDTSVTTSRTLKRQNKSRNQLDASRSQIWPFELKLPRWISWGPPNTDANGRPVPPISSPTFSPALTTEIHRDQNRDQTIISGKEGQGSVRAELAGYGAGWNDVPFANTSKNAGSGPGSSGRHRTDSNTRHALSNLFLEKPADTEKDFDSTPEVDVDDKRTFKLPPSFSERASPAYLEYRLIVTVKMRGAFKDNVVLQKLLLVQTSSFAEPIPRSLTQKFQGKVYSSILPGPERQPEIWKIMPEVVMQVQQKGNKAKRAKMPGSTNMDVMLKLAIARPLSYVRGTCIPFRITVSVPQSSSALVMKAKQGSSAPPTSFHSKFASFPISPFALDVFPDSPNVSSEAEGKSGQFSHDKHRVRMHTEAASQMSTVPSITAIASAIRLVRAIYVGDGATNDEGSRISSASFLRPVSRAVIFSDSHTSDIPASKKGGLDARDKSTDPVSEGWISSRGRWIKSFHGEIPLNGDLKSSFVFSQFVLKYAVVLFPFEAPDFAPLSDEPLWSETVMITTNPAKDGTASGYVSSATTLSKAGYPVMRQDPQRGQDTFATELRGRDVHAEPKQQGDWQDAFGALSMSHAMTVGFTGRG